jgi:catechol 2,3-dioxygenase-like lactoylglutathione lyase family enzyme
MDHSPIGRFLEISVHAPDVPASLAFYESLGFEQAKVGEAWAYPYAVVTDGRLFIGLHGEPIRSPALTFVLPDLRRAVEELEASGVAFDELRLGDDVFNQAAFTDPTGHCVRLLEARTFSPPQIESPAGTTCGYFLEYGIPTRDTASARTFWEPLGFVGMDEQTDPFPRLEMTSDHLDMGLYRSRAFRQPVLAFEAEDMRERLARLKERGHTLSDEMPDTLDETLNAVLVAPEGTRLLLLQATA